MRIYIAGSSKETEACAKMMRAVEAQGHMITHDWTEAVMANGGEGNPVGLSNEAAAEYATLDLQAVAQAGVIWLMCPDKPTCGAWVQLGYALAIKEHYPRLRILISGNMAQCIFTRLGTHFFKTHEEALEWLGQRI